MPPKHPAHLPSGKLTWLAGTSPFIKFGIHLQNGSFSVAMFVCQRVIGKSSLDTPTTAFHPHHQTWSIDHRQTNRALGVGDEQPTAIFQWNDRLRDCIKQKPDISYKICLLKMLGKQRILNILFHKWWWKMVICHATKVLKNHLPTSSSQTLDRLSNVMA